MKKLDQKGFSLIVGLLIILIIAVIVFAGYYVYNEQSNKNSNNEEITTTQTVVENDVKSSQEDSPAKVQTLDLVDYNPTIRIQKKGDVEKLKDASEGFKDFIATYVGNQPEEGDCPITVTIHKIAKDELAVGGINQCAGARYVWKKTDGLWAEVRSLGGQDYASCVDVIDHKIPSFIIDRCYDPSLNDVIDNPNN